MKKFFLIVLLLSVYASVAWAEASPDFIEFQKVIDDQCSRCHSRTRVDQAMKEHRDMLEIQQRMLKHGAELNTRQQQVLGVFFRGNGVSDKQPSSKKADPLAEYRSVVELRCTGCHGLEIVEQAMRQKRGFADLSQLMIKRGAVLNDKDMKVIQTFWGEPLR
jgi:uncharacterized membrane protein